MEIWHESGIDVGCLWDLLRGAGLSLSAWLSGASPHPIISDALHLLLGSRSTLSPPQLPLGQALFPLSVSPKKVHFKCSSLPFGFGGFFFLPKTVFSINFIIKTIPNS